MRVLKEVTDTLARGGNTGSHGVRRGVGVTVFKCLRPNKKVTNNYPNAKQRVFRALPPHLDARCSVFRRCPAASVSYLGRASPRRPPRRRARARRRRRAPRDARRRRSAIPPPPRRLRFRAVVAVSPRAPEARVWWHARRKAGSWLRLKR